MAAAEARVPRRVALTGAQGSLTIASVRRETSGKRARVVVLVGAPDGVAAQIFLLKVRRRNGLCRFLSPESNALASPDGMRRYIFDL